MSNLTIKQIRDNKAALERAILWLVEDFENSTGVCVKRVELRARNYGMALSRKTIAEINIELESL